jgi:hypothetical protein
MKARKESKTLARDIHSIKEWPKSNTTLHFNKQMALISTFGNISSSAYYIYVPGVQSAG